MHAKHANDSVRFTAMGHALGARTSYASAFS
jgi:hypothetical protein